MRKGFALFSNLRTITVFMLVFTVGYVFSVKSIRNGNLVLAAPKGGYEKAPDLALKKLEGGKINLSDYRGTWVFLNLWATWCPACVEEMPSLEKFYRKFKSKNLTVLAVSVDRADSRVVRDFVKKYGLTFEIFLDPENSSLRTFGAGGIPATYVINPKGEIVAEAVGPRDWMDPVIVDYFVGLMSPEKQTSKKQ